MAVLYSNMQKNNSAICWNSFTIRILDMSVFFLIKKPVSVKISYFSQSAGNCLRIGSSETTRAISDEKKFNEWLAGFIEGDGSFTISKLGYCSCEITVHEKELKVLLLIKKKVGGVLAFREGVKMARLRLHNKLVMERLLRRLVGLVITQKKELVFKLMCGKLNIKLESNEQIKPGWTNGWLAGFIDAEGSFNIKKTTYQVSFSLAQKQKEILESCCAETKIGTVYYDKSWNGWVWFVSSKEELQRLLSYLEVYPLRTPKNIEVIKIKRVLLFKERGYHLQHASIREQEKLKSLLEYFRNRKKI